jgi:hypothetical protein
VVGVEHGGHLLQRVRIEETVAVENEQARRGRCGGAGVDGSGKPATRRVEQASAGPFRFGRAVVGRGVVDDDDLGGTGRASCLDAAADEPVTVVVRDDDGDVGQCRTSFVAIR